MMCNVCTDTLIYHSLFICVYNAGCSQGYNISLYDDHASINTEGVEQANSELCKFKSSLSYMNRNNFISLLELSLYYHNKKHLDGNL